MNAPSVRSVTVRLNAEVAKYIADIKRAGAATDKAFDSAHATVSRFDDDLSSATKASDALATQTKQTTKETTGLGDSVDRTSKKVKAYTLEMAVADERASRLKQSLREQAKAAVDAEMGLDRASDSAVRSAASFDRSGNAIDRTSGRLAILAKVVATIGPALGPIGAVGIAGLSGLASQLGFAAVGVGSLVVASQGLGDALKAVEKARLEPTVENIQAAQQAMAQLGPDAQEFVAHLQQLRPVFGNIREQAGAGWFPGLSEALDHFEDVAPRIGRIFKEIGETGGSLLSDAAESFAGPEWADFLTFVKREAPAALEDLGRSAGALVHGMARLWMAFSPVNNDFGDWLVRTSRGFDTWASNLSKTKGFEEFVEYIRQNGPKVGEAFGAIANAVLQIVEAAAPLGGPVLEAITGLANAIAAVADSPLGTPIMAAVTAISAMSLAANIGTAAVTRLNGALIATGAAGTKASAGLKGLAGGPAGIAAAIGLSNLSDAFDNIGMVLDGDRGPVEGMARLVAGMSPVGQVAELVGINVFGTKESFLEAAGASAKLAAEQAGLAKASERSADIQLELAARAARTRKAMAEQAEAVAKTAEQWTDYSQKVQLGKTSVDQLMNRWEKLGEASANMGENIQEALKRGLDPEVIKNVIDTLGPQGAAAALEEFANATGDRAKEIEADFERMGDGVKNFSTSYDLLTSLVNGTPLTMSNDLIFELDQIKGAFESLPKDVRTQIRADGIPSTEAQVDGLVAKYKLTEKDRKALLFLIDHASGPIQGILNLLSKVKDKHVTVTTTYIREIINKKSTVPQSPQNPTLEDLLGGADGMTVPGQRHPYGDKILIKAAPGEEIISNRHGQADRFRADRAAGRIPAYGDGGTVGGDSWTTYTRGADNAVERWSRQAAAALKSLAGTAKQSTADFGGALGGATSGASAFSGAVDGATSGSGEFADVVDGSTKSLERELKARERLLNKELAAIEDRISALRDEREAIKDSIATLIEGSAGLWDSIREAVIPAIGSTDDITWQDTDATFDSASDQLQFQFNNASELADLIKKLKKKGFDGPALAALLQSASIETIRDFANQTRDELAAFEEQYEATQNITNQVGNQGANAVGINAEMRELRKEARETNRKLDSLNKHAKHLDETGPERTGRTVGRVLNGAGGRAMTGARRSER